MKTKYLLTLSILSGLLLTFSWPENGFYPLIFVAFVPLLFVQQYLGETKKKGMFLYSYLSFIIWNVLTTWWIWNSTSVGSVAAFMLNALFMSTVFQLFHISKKRYYNNLKGSWILIFYWISWEYFHLNWELSWSWLNLGHVFATTPKIIQWYEYTGTFGGSIWVLAVNVLIFNIINGLIKQSERKKIVISSSILFLALIVPITSSLIIYSNYTEKGKDVNVVVVQPNIDPYLEQYSLHPDSILSRNLNLAMAEVDENTDYVVLPESALQEDIWEGALNNSHSINRIFDTIKNHTNLRFIVGATSYRMINDSEKKNNAARKFKSVDKYYYAYNTAFLIDKTGFIQTHHKSKLVPGVETMPSWGILKPIEGLAIDLGGTVGTLGKDKAPVVFSDYDSVGLSPIICFESVYGEFTAKTVKRGGQIIIVITNDGWWGNTPGYRQHLYFSALRAIETRRYVARSANTGISAIINQRGDILQRTKYWQTAVLKADIKASKEITYYVKMGDYIAKTSAYISVLIFLIAMSQSFLRKRKRI